MYRRLLTYLFLLSTICLYAQRLEVTDFEELPMDLSARRPERLDNRNVPCALIKVQLLVDGALFKGSVMGDVRYEANTYWVYMAHGAKRLTINAPGFYTRTVEFSDFGINYVESAVTYQLIVETTTQTQKSSYEIYQEALAVQARLDSIAKIEQARLDSIAKIEQARLDSIAKIEDPLFCQGFVGYENQHACVDLGLSVLWSPEDISGSLFLGLLYSWGESRRKVAYDWNSYSFCVKGNPAKMTKYKNGVITQLQSEDDAARVKWGGRWRMPTKEEWQELIDLCRLEFVVLKGYKMLRVIGPNGNYITLSTLHGMFTTDKIYGLYYWSSSLSDQTDKLAWAVYMPMTNEDVPKNQLQLSLSNRCYGLAIRPVCDKPNK